jgi:signal transduction histidine kinase
VPEDVHGPDGVSSPPTAGAECAAAAAAFCAPAGAGPELANGGDVAPCPDWTPCAIALSVRRLIASKLAHGALLWGVIVALALVGYPPWRIGVLVCCYLAQTVSELVLLRSIPRTREGELFWDRAGDLPGRAVHLFLFAIAGAVQLAMTGGLESPLVATHVVPFLAGVAILGPSRRTALLGALTFSLAVVLALLPPAWVGPRVPSPAFELIVLAGLFVAVVVVGTNVSFTVDALRGTQGAFLRSREAAARAALARARSLEQVGATVAHELKNPLTAVKALVQLGARNPAEAASHERLETIEREVERMQGTLQDYLSFSRPLRPLAPEPLDLGAIAGDVLAAVSARAEAAGVALGLSGKAVVDADPRRVEEALLNLVANAVEATPRGGRVDVEVERVDGIASIRVRDSGRGMAPDVLARVGTPFFTTRDEGTGLGVVLARAAFVQHGGALRFESAPGVGTTAIATLPVRCAAGGGHGPYPARR